MLEKYLDLIRRPEEVGTKLQILTNVSLEVEVDRDGEKKNKTIAVSELLYEENAIYLLAIQESESIDKVLIKSTIDSLHPLYGIIVLNGDTIVKSFDSSGKKSKSRRKKDNYAKQDSIIDRIINKISKCVELSPNRVINEFSSFHCDTLYVGHKVFWPIRNGKLYNPIEFRGQSLFQFTSIDRVKAILDEKENSMTSLIAMNDKSEYAKWGPVSNWNNIGAVDKDVFIKSLCKEKSLDMWRLYGQDGQGACLEYEFTGYLPKGYILNEVCYDTKALYAFGSGSKFFRFLPIVPNGTLYRHFLKNDHYKIENEVRLMYKTDNKSVKYYTSGAGKIIPVLNINQSVFPLKIKKIWLGWLSSYKDRNIISLGMLAPNIDAEIDEEFNDYIGN